MNPVHRVASLLLLCASSCTLVHEQFLQKHNDQASAADVLCRTRKRCVFLVSLRVEPCMWRLGVCSVRAARTELSDKYTKTQTLAYDPLAISTTDYQMELSACVFGFLTVQTAGDKNMARALSVVVAALSWAQGYQAAPCTISRTGSHRAGTRQIQRSPLARRFAALVQGSVQPTKFGLFWLFCDQFRTVGTPLTKKARKTSDNVGRWFFLISHLHPQRESELRLLVNPWSSTSPWPLQVTRPVRTRLLEWTQRAPGEAINAEYFSAAAALTSRCGATSGQRAGQRRIRLGRTAPRSPCAAVLAEGSR